jgi:hypothetical protein
MDCGLLDCDACNLLGGYQRFEEHFTSIFSVAVDYVRK